MSTPFDLSGLRPAERPIIEAALASISFNFGALIPGLVAQVRRSTIPVTFADLSQYRAALEKRSGSEHNHLHIDGDTAHPIDLVGEDGVRRRVLGLAYYSGKVVVEASLVGNAPLAMEVFIAEAAHMVDFFFMTPAHRSSIFAAYHSGEAIPHDHGWFEETGNEDYWSWVGESFMYGFAAAFSTIQTSGDSFMHRTTPEIGAKIRDILQPREEIVRRQGSSIAHRRGGWHERQIADVLEERYATVDSARQAGLRLCRTCRWTGINVPE